MAKLQAKRITDALKKAQRVGEVEEPFILDGCELVLRSLTPSEIEAATVAANEYEDIAFLHAFKRERICRSIVEINGESLREYAFVEVEVEETNPTTGEVSLKEVSLERHQFVADYVLASWSGEAMDTAYRKFNDVVAKAEKKAVEGVSFSVPEEAPEDQYRRLLREAKELEGQIPFELAGRILDEVGYVSKSSKEELEAMEEKLSKASLEEADSSPTLPLEAPLAASSRPQAATPLPDARALVAARVPLNQRAVSIPSPVSAQEPVRASPRGAVPPLDLQAHPVIPASPAALKRAQELAAIESAGPIALDPAPAVQGGTVLTGEVPELNKPMARLDPNAAERIFEQPPTAGINARYRPPPRMP
jgi:hypothetical protein